MKNENKLNERILVTVTLNLMHRMQDFQDFKKEQGFSGDFEAKVAYLVEKVHISEGTAENLLSGKVVSHSSYLAIFPSFDSESNSSMQTGFEELAELISKEIRNGDEKTLKEVDSILFGKLDKLDLKELVNAESISLLEDSSQSRLKRLRKPSKFTDTSDYAWAVWNSFFEKYILKRDDQYEIFAKFTVIEKAMDNLSLIEKIFESEENIEIFYQVAKRLDLFDIVDTWDDWDNLEKFIKSVQTRNGLDNYLS